MTRAPHMSAPPVVVADSTSTPKKLRSHALEPITPDDVRRALRHAIAVDANDLWLRACDPAGVHPGAEQFSPAQLDRVVDFLIAQQGRVGLIGRSLQVRSAVYRALDRRGADARPPDFDWGQVAAEILLRGRVSLPERIDELDSLSPFAPENRPHLDQAAARLARRLNGHLGAVTIVLDDALAIAGTSTSSITNPDTRPGSSAGAWIAEAGGIPIEWSMCATVVRTGEPYAVVDLTTDVLHRLNPTVVHDGIRAYAGAPLITTAGEILGACCVLDTRPRTFSDDDMTALVDEATAVVARLERRRDETRPAAT